MICGECQCPIEADEDPSEFEDRHYHWSCLQELYERDRLADEAGEL